MDIFLGLGSNVGDRRANLQSAIEALERGGVRVVRLSPVIESPALLPEGALAEWNRPFLNLVAKCATDLDPETVLSLAKRIEAELGRGDADKWAPRPADIDILLWGRERIVTDRLRIPHPELERRNFALTPLIALEPSLTIPGLGANTVLDWSSELDDHIPLWMGIFNITPDSFSDGGELVDWAAIESRAERAVAAGAQFLDLGAESTRPGARLLSAEQEWSRLAPVLERLVDKYAGQRLRPLISVDTYHVDIARRALESGADMINDVSGLTSPEMIELASANGADFVAMHSVTLPADPARTLPTDCDPCETLERWLDERMAVWTRAGVDLDRIIFDPGIGFGKDPLQSLRLLRGAAGFRRSGLRCLVGHSRKSFMKSFAPVDNEARDLATAGASLNLIAQGVDFLRVHNVPLNASAWLAWAHLN